MAHNKCLSRIDFSYSKSDVSNKFGCSICANTIYGRDLGSPKLRHLVVINDSTIAVYENGSSTYVAHWARACPVKLRQWEDEDMGQF